LSLGSVFLGMADQVAEALGVLSRPLSAGRFLSIACRKSGANDFGSIDLQGPLQRLLDASVTEAALSVVGRFAIRWDTLRFLGNLLRLRHEEAIDPAILSEPIERPIFITGLPRSGTTFLHRLLLEDGINRGPVVWETIYPYPLGEPIDRRRQHVARQLHRFENLAPEFHSLHPLAADSPQECSEITAHVFRSLRFDTTYRVPSYRAWLDAEGHPEAYRFERRFLQHLQHQLGWRRWVLKCPDHLFALTNLRAAFPDARIVFVHRDPVKVMLSICRLTEVLRRPFTRQVDRMAIGRDESARWLEGTARMIAACQEPIFQEPICHVNYLDLVANPLRTVAQVYDHFHLDLDTRTAGRMARAADEQPNGGYGRHSYHFEDHGLNAETEREKFREYIEFFGIEPEPRQGKVTVHVNSQAA
jgi:LPS sulfotransferase NodH